MAEGRRVITRCARCDQDRCTECTPTLLCNGCLGVDPQVKTCLDCEHPFCTFCDEAYGSCKECEGAICPGCWYLSNRSERAGACRPCTNPLVPIQNPQSEAHPLPKGFSLYTKEAHHYTKEEKGAPKPPWKYPVTDPRRKAWMPPHDPKTGRFLKKGQSADGS